MPGLAFTGLRLPDLRQRTEVLLLPHEEEVRSRAAGPSKRSGRGRAAELWGVWCALMGDPQSRDLTRITPASRPSTPKRMR